MSRLHKINKPAPKATKVIANGDMITKIRLVKAFSARQIETFKMEDDARLTFIFKEK